MQKGSKQSQEAKDKISLARTGKTSWNKNIAASDETKQKMSIAKTGKIMSDEFKEKRRQIMKERWADPKFKEEMSKKHSGSNNGNFGIKMSDVQKAKIRAAANNRSSEWREKQSIAHTGVIDSDETRLKKSLVHRGDKNYNWNNGITALNLHIRNLLQSKEICQKKMNDVNYTDYFTKLRGKVLECHHIIPQNVIIKMNEITTIDQARECAALFDEKNLIVMLKTAHDKFHNLYGDNKIIFDLSEGEIKTLYD